MTTFSARSIRIGQPWSCLLRISAVGGAPLPDLTSASLIVQFRHTAISNTVLTEIRSGAGITVVAADTVRLSLTETQTAKLIAPHVEFALARRDGGLREISPTLRWPTIIAHTRGIAP